MRRAVDVVREIFPNAKQAYVDAFDVGDDQLEEAGITRPLRLAHLLGQCNGETGGLTLLRESLKYTTEARLQSIFNNMSKTVPLLPGEVRMLLRQERDLGERFYGLAFDSELYANKGVNGGVNPGNKRKARKLGNDRVGDGFLFRGNGLLQTTGGAAHKAAGDAVGVDFFNNPDLVTDPAHALKAMLFEWNKSNCNSFADADNVMKISRAINLGNPNSTSTPNGMDDRKRGVRKAKAALGI